MSTQTKWLLSSRLDEWMLVEETTDFLPVVGLMHQPCEAMLPLKIGGSLALLIRSVERHRCPPAVGQ